MKQWLRIGLALASLSVVAEDNSLLEKAYNLCNAVGMMHPGHLHVVTCIDAMDSFVQEHPNASVEEMVNEQCRGWDDGYYYFVDMNECLAIAMENDFIEAH